MIGQQTKGTMWALFRSMTIYVKAHSQSWVKLILIWFGLSSNTVNRVDLSSLDMILGVVLNVSINTLS